MGKSFFTANWETEFKEDVRNIQKGSGLTVSSNRQGNIEVKYRKNGTSQTTTIPFSWSKETKGDAYTRIRNIYKFIAEGHSLKAAADLAQGKAPKKGKDWAYILKNFKYQKLNFGKATTEATFDKQYKPACEMAVELMGGKNPPMNPADLIDMCVKDWAAGSRTRQMRARAVKQFLTHAVTREGIADIWTPPTNLKPHIGEAKPQEKINKEGDHFEDDQQIINFLETLPINSPFERDAVAAEKWLNAFRLMAELGLRPIEVGYLKVKKDPTTKEFYWWCDYRKKSGGGTTEPRRVEPLPLIDKEGKEQEWNLINRFKTNTLPLPDRVDGEACNTYLQRKESWKSLKKMMKETQGMNIVAYSFRHSYSLRAHVLGIDSGSVSMSMGHTLEAHHRAYPYASKASTTNAFKRARERAKA